MIKNNKKGIISAILVILSILIIISVPNVMMISDKTKTIVLVGKNGLMLLLLATLCAFVIINEKAIQKAFNKIILYIILCLLLLIPALIFANTQFVWLIPFTTAAIIIAIMLNAGLGIITNIFMVLLITVVGDLSVDFLLFYAVSGTISCLLINNAKERRKIFYVSIYVMIVNIFMIFFINLVHMTDNVSIDFKQIVFVVINAALSIIIATGSLPLWETLFNITTPYKLMELTNSNQKLLQRLMLEAPGTYHHSQMVANLSEMAAMDIGSNAVLARTGALYHDIGKLKDPSYFIENQNGSNPHDELAPDSSAKLIITHVSDGVKLAVENKLPDQVIEIIKQHQGDSTVKYFFEKAKKHSDGFEIDEKLFKYAGPKPLTNEAAIVMLADCVEACVRSVDENSRTLENIKKMIGDVIYSKFKDGQLDASELKISDLQIISSAFLRVYNGMYHERVQHIKE